MISRQLTLSVMSAKKITKWAKKTETGRFLIGLPLQAKSRSRSSLLDGGFEGTVRVSPVRMAARTTDAQEHGHCSRIHSRMLG